MNCPKCGKKPVGFMGTLILRGAGFKRAFQGFFRCKHCDALLIQDKNESGMPKYENPFWVVYCLFLAGMLAVIWGIFTYLENSIGADGSWYFIPGIVVIFIVLFMIVDWIRARYWILKETTFDEHEEEVESQKLSTKGVIAFLIFSVAAIVSFIFLDDYAENFDLSATAYTLSAIGYMCIILVMAFGLMKYLSGNNAPETDQ